MVECEVMTKRGAEEAAHHLTSYGRVDCIALTPPASPRKREGEKGACTVCEAALRGHSPPVETDAVHQFAAYQSGRSALPGSAH